MSIYLSDVPYQKAKDVFYGQIRDLCFWHVLRTEIINVDEFALGRVLAEPVYAKLSSPGFNAAAMDGFAVKASETVGASIGKPIILNYGEKTIYVDTGDLIPNEFDAVIPIENIEPIDNDGEILIESRLPERIQIREAVAPWSHIRLMGEDLNPKQLLFYDGYKIGDLDLSVIASAGVKEIVVAAKPRVAIIPTGSELIPVGQEPLPGQITESNSLFIAGKIIGWGGDATRCEFIKDDVASITSAVKRAAQEYDLILVNAGSSAGSEDFTSKIIEENGELLIHGVAIRPGHPVVLGFIKSGKKNIPIIGVPGFPVSAALTMDLFVKELIFTWQGLLPEEDDFIDARLSRKITSPGGDLDFVQVLVARVGVTYVAAPVSKGAGVLSTVANSDGALIIPEGVQGIQANEEVKIKLCRNKREVDRNILVIGSHDFLLDELGRFLSKKGRRFSSVNVGSLGGLIAVNSCNCHLAGSHLLDPESGIYNVKYVQDYIQNVKVRVIALAYREQGLIVKEGNPLGINGFDDLLRQDIVFCNRQKGSGTRVLLDYHLKSKGIVPGEIRGYEHEEFTHMGVASAIISGRSDFGLGIAAATEAYDLMFIPLFKERYDLVINAEDENKRLLEPLIEALQDNELKKELRLIKGYDLNPMGTEINF